LHIKQSPNAERVQIRAALRNKCTGRRRITS
jgi:hypothetical protein